MLDISYNQYDNYAEVFVDGIFDIHSADQLRKLVLNKIHKDKIKLDLSEVTVIDSSGIVALIQIRKGKELEILSLSEAVRKVIATTGLLEYLNIKKTI